MTHNPALDAALALAATGAHVHYATPEGERSRCLTGHCTPKARP